jgi:hypothetical protein
LREAEFVVPKATKVRARGAVCATIVMARWARLERSACTQAFPSPPSPGRSAVGTQLRPVRSGRTYRIISPPGRGLVTPDLAEALEAVFERLATERGFTHQQPLTIGLSRGFAPGSMGHAQGRAVDIAVVGGKRVVDWKREWDEAAARARASDDRQEQATAIAQGQNRNLGHALYRALLAQGDWLVDPAGWRVYRGVMQLFGPWTESEGPWKPMHFDNPTPYQRGRLADQAWVYRAHQDHIHVAK